MYFLKNIIKSKSKPYYDSSASDFFYKQYEIQSLDEKIIIYRVLREIRHKGRDLCSIDCNLKYTYQFKNGKVKEIDLKNTGRRKSAKKLLDCMVQSIDEIKTFNVKTIPLDKDNIVLYTYLTNFGTYQDVYEINKHPESGISAYVFTTFWNYVDLVDPNRQNKLRKVLNK